MVMEARNVAAERVCGNCQYFQKHRGSDHGSITEIDRKAAEGVHGECRAALPVGQVRLWLPPHGPQKRQLIGEWPLVSGGAWCGKHSPLPLNVRVEVKGDGKQPMEGMAVCVALMLVTVVVTVVIML